MMHARQIVGIVLCCVMGALFAPAQAAEKASDLYLLQIPALGEDTVEHPNNHRYLMRLYGEGGKRILRIVFPDFAFREFNVEDFWNQGLPPGLAFTTQEDLDGAVTIAGMIVEIPGYFSVTSEGRQERAGYWEGEAMIKLFPYGHEMRGYLKSRWCLQPAPESVVYARMVAALDHLEYLARSKSAGLDSARLQTRDDYVAFLRRQEWPLPRRTLSWKPIDPAFQREIADALADGRIVMREDGFAASEEVTKRFETEAPLLEIDTTVTAHGLPEHEAATLTKDERELENLLRYEYRPPASPYNLRELAALPKEARDKSLRRIRKESARFVSEMDYTWEELQFIPDVAFLVGYIASCPKELQEPVAQRYINDGSKGFFPDMNCAELARVPNPVLLVACLPHMERQAKEQAEEFSAILQEEGYTLEEFEAGKVSGTARVRMGRKYSRWSILTRQRMRLDQAAKLSQTERVKRLLEVSGLTIEEIRKYSIPQLVAKVLSPVPSQEARALVDETPKFKEYLRDSEDEELKALVRQKGLKLEPAPTD